MVKGTCNDDKPKDVVTFLICVSRNQRFYRNNLFDKNFKVPFLMVEKFKCKTTLY